MYSAKPTEKMPRTNSEASITRLGVFRRVAEREFQSRRFTIVTTEVISTRILAQFLPLQYSPQN